MQELIRYGWLEYKEERPGIGMFACYPTLSERGREVAGI
jgi:hypothetical protein